MSEQTELLGRDVGLGDGADLNAPIEWRGLPEFRPAAAREHKLVLTFDTEEARDALIAQLGVVIAKKTGPTWSAWYPPREKEDLAALRFDFEAPEQADPSVCPACGGSGPDVYEPGEYGGDGDVRCGDDWHDRFGVVEAGTAEFLARAEAAGIEPETLAAAESYGREISEQDGVEISMRPDGAAEYRVPISGNVDDD
jgi:hypothetical protein